MVRLARSAAFCLAFIAGCATPFQGVRLRADLPFIDEAFKKLTIALTLDGYELETVDPATRFVETKWKELGETDREPKLADAGVRQEGKVRIKLEERGKFYDVFLTPSIRADGTPERVCKPTERLWVKWETALHRLLVIQAKEE
jgi:hypothetical protein